MRAHDCPLRIRVTGNAMTGPDSSSCAYTGARCISGEYCDERRATARDRDAFNDELFAISPDGAMERR